MSVQALKLQNRHVDELEGVLMNAIRIRKHLDRPIAELPELSELVGKNIEIIVFEDISMLSEKPKRADFDQLMGGWPIEEPSDNFEDTVNEWRSEPWRSSSAANEADGARE